MAKQTPFRMTKLSEIKPYERNPRIIPQAAVDAVAKSIAAFGFRQPIVVDGHGVILAGHTRYKAAQQLGLDEVPVVWQTDITEIQARGYRIADNKTGEIAAWDRDALDVEVRELAEIADADLDALGLAQWELDRILHDCDVSPVAESEGRGEVARPGSTEDAHSIAPHKAAILEDAPSSTAAYAESIGAGGPLKYFSSAKGLIYEPDPSKAPKDALDCVATDRYQTFINELAHTHGLSDSERELLRISATRFYEFDYTKIANYYACAGSAMQAAMRRLALVIVDFDEAIRAGLVECENKIMGLLDTGGEE